LLAHGFLDGVKARLDPSPFLCPLGLWLLLGVATGIKSAQDDTLFLVFWYCGSSGWFFLKENDQIVTK
jgi:hypothetical protein